MGVGVSYTGYDGATRRVNVSGVDEARAALGETERAGRSALNDAEGLLARARKPKSRLDMFGDGRRDVKVLAGGSVVNGPNGVCLRGEETNPLVEGKRMFASVNGRKGFFALGEIDPAMRGALVGIGDRRDQYTPEVSSKDAPDGSPWSITVGSRIVMREDEDAKMIVFYEFYKELNFSAEGRVIGVSAERNRVIGQIPKSEGGGGKYEVRPVFSDIGGGKAIESLLFGDAKLLDGDVEEVEKRDGVSKVEVVVHGGIS